MTEDRPRSIDADGTTFRDLNGNGVMDPYEDPRLSPKERTEDLLSRLSLAEKVGLMFQTVIECGPGGTVLEEPGHISKSATSSVVHGKLMNHFNVHALEGAREAARWSNAVQRLAADTPHGIPVTISTDPRHAFVENSGVSFAAGPFSQWPEALGFAAIGDEDTIRQFARIARDEYRAVGIRAALHPQIDLATEPRWGRQLQTMGSDADRVSAFTAAYLEGFQGDSLGTDSVACTTKHFPGGGPQKDGEDAHFPYGREQVYPGGRFEEHLAPFKTAIARGTAAMMPYYGMPVGLSVDGEPIEEVGFGYNRQILDGLLRQKLGYDGVIVTDWELVNDNVVGEQVLPARAWGVEHLTPKERMLRILVAGADQFGGEECVDMLLELVADGLVTESRIDESARRLLLVKFELGLFDDPYVDEEKAVEIVGSSASADAGRIAQSRSVTILENRHVDGRRALPLHGALKVYVEGVGHDAASRLGEVVSAPEDADVAVVRLDAPFDPRDDLFLESYFRQGSLEFRPGLLARLRTLAEKVPVIIDVSLDRAAVLTPLVAIADALTVTFGVSDEAFVDVLQGAVAAEGRLPVELPRTMDDVRRSDPDVPHFDDPLYALGAGLTL